MTIIEDPITDSSIADPDRSLVLDQDAVVDLHHQGVHLLVRALLHAARAQKAGRPAATDSLSARARRFALQRVHAELTDPQLRTLALHDPDGDLRAATLPVLAERGAVLDERTLRTLASDPSYKVRLEVLRLPELPVWAILRLALDADPLVRAVALEDARATTAMLLSVLRAAETAEQAAAVCRSHRLDLEAILPSLHVDNPAVREAVALSLLARPDLPRTLLEDCLDEHHTELVRATTVLHPQLPFDLVITQATSTSPVVRRAVAMNPLTDAATLHVLHDDSDLSVRIAVIEHQSTGPATIAVMVRDCSASVRSRAIRHPRITSASLLEAASDPDAGVRRDLLGRQPLDGRVLRVLATDPEADIRLRAVQHVRCPLDALVTAASDPDVRVRRTTATLERCPARALRELIVDDDPLVRRLAARHRSTPVACLDHAARRDRDPVVQRTAVRNPSCSEPTLAWARAQDHLLLPALANPAPTEELFPLLAAIEQQQRRRADQVRELQRAIRNPQEFDPLGAEHPRITERAREVRHRLLEQIAEQPYAWIRQHRGFYVLPDHELAFVIGTHLRAIATEPKRRVRRAALEHPAISARDLHAFAKDEVNDHRLLVARNALTQRRTLGLLVDDPSAAVRAAVASHQRADRSILVRLAGDPDDEVRAAASRRLLEAL